MDKIVSTKYCQLRIEEEEGYLTKVDFVQQEIPSQTNQTNLVLEQASYQLQQYFEGKLKIFTLPIKLKGTPFQKSVWNELLNIAYGTTCSYKEIATKIGRPEACRAIGNANHHNPIAIIVPCHRVIGSSGKLVGYASGLDLKSKLLTLEKDNR